MVPIRWYLWVFGLINCLMSGREVQDLRIPSFPLSEQIDLELMVRF